MVEEIFQKFYDPAQAERDRICEERLAKINELKEIEKISQKALWKLQTEKPKSRKWKISK